MIVRCDYCGKKFNKIPAAISATNHNFCSRQCAGKFRKKPNALIFEDKIAKIIIDSPTHGRKFAIIDIEDVDKIKGFNWVLSNKKYVYCNELNSQIQRIILNYSGELDIDHINKNPLDNRKDNLRICSHLENMQNQNARIKNSTGIKNIYYNKKSQSYHVDIVYKGVRHSKGCFKNIEDAQKALKELKRIIAQ